MSIFTPTRRWQPAFYPFKKEKFTARLLEKIELIVKGPLYGCRMCGNCLLQETAFICHMLCPKGLRNGPCGGVTPENNCYVDETRPCIWHRIYEKASKMNREELLLEVLPPVDWDRAGRETWGSVIKQIRKVGAGTFIGGVLSRDKVKRSVIWDSVFIPVRQPEWWRGDSEYHSPGYSQPVSELERRLKNGEFVFTTEVMPPLNADTEKLRQKIEMVKPYVAAVNFTDSASASPRMSSIACSNVSYLLKAEPVLQIAARDKTRTALQAEVVGANDLGIKNVLCISGDSARIGPVPTGNLNILDIDSVQMLWVLRRMRDEGLYLDGRKMEKPPKIFLGAATTPSALRPELQAIRDHKKVNAGAQFFQTNLIFDTKPLELWLEQLDKRNVLDKVYILIGIIPLKSYRTARYLNDNIPGVTIPVSLMERMEKAGESAQEEGIRIALELIESLRKMKGVNGIHLMTLNSESAVGRIVKETGMEPK